MRVLSFSHVRLPLAPAEIPKRAQFSRLSLYVNVPSFVDISVVEWRGDNWFTSTRI
jgi:hypothetical protein